MSVLGQPSSLRLLELRARKPKPGGSEGRRENAFMPVRYQDLDSTSSSGTNCYHYHRCQRVKAGKPISHSFQVYRTSSEEAIRP